MPRRVIYVIDFSDKSKSDKQLMALEVGLSDGVGIERCDSVSVCINEYSSDRVTHGKLVYVLSIPDAVEFPLKG